MSQHRVPGVGDIVEVLDCQDHGWVPAKVASVWVSHGKIMFRAQPEGACYFFVINLEYEGAWRFPEPAQDVVDCSN